MEFCPVCKSELPSDVEVCPGCKFEVGNHADTKWIQIGSIEDQVSSDYAKETLKSNNIPVVILSKSGFFGSAGLPLNPFYGTNDGFYSVLVPEDFVEEAVDILNIVLADNWEKKDLK